MPFSIFSHSIFSKYSSNYLIINCNLIIFHTTFDGLFIWIIDFKVGCDNVHINCAATDVNYVMGSYNDGGWNLREAKECLQRKCVRQSDGRYVNAPQSWPFEIANCVNKFLKFFFTFLVPLANIYRVMLNSYIILHNMYHLLYLCWNICL